MSELLTKFFEKNDISWNGKCWSCKKKKRRHSKLIRLYNVNEYLIITLQRFDAETSKINNCLVTFESSLNLKNYLDLELYKGESCFVFKGAINHIGHYYCFIKIENEWYKFNDCNVEKISELEYRNDSAYVLIYQKVD